MPQADSSVPSPAAGAPASPARLELIDALRGVALLGVFLVNLRWFSLYAFLDAEARAALPTAGFDEAVLAVMAGLVDAKAITVFSLLFGVGFALQMERIAAGDHAGLRRYLRRLGVLALIGLVHGLFVWWGDILLTYAVAGLLLVPFRRASPRTLLVGALLAAVLLPPLLSPWMRGWLGAMPDQTAAWAAALQGFSAPSAGEAWRANLDLAAWVRVSNWALLGFVLGRFLLGDWAGRAGLLQDPLRHRALLGRICLGALALGLLAAWLGAAQAGLRAQHAWLDTAAMKYAIRAALRCEPLALGIAFAAGFAWLYPHRAWRAAFARFAPVGRMALSHYLLQSVLCVPLFYGFGAGIGPRFGLAAVLVVGGTVFALQVLASHWWLRRYRQGPVEWAWRALADGRAPPFRRAAVARAAVPAASHTPSSRS